MALAGKDVGGGKAGRTRSADHDAVARLEVSRVARRHHSLCLHRNATIWFLRARGRALGGTIDDGGPPTCPDPSPELSDVAQLESDWDKLQPFPGRADPWNARDRLAVGSGREAQIPRRRW